MSSKLYTAAEFEAEKARKREEAKKEREEARERKLKAEKLKKELRKAEPPISKAPPPPPTPPKVSNPMLQAAVEEAFTLPYEPPSYHFGPNDDPYAEIAQRELCRRKILPFIQRFRPKYTAGWVHEDICRRVERFVEQVELGQSPRLLLLCPPRTGKSEIGSRHVAPWALGKHPEWEIIATSNSASLSLSFSRYIRDLMRDPGYQSVFPDAKLDPSSQSVENWNLTRGGGYMAAGVGTGIVGRGAHILLVDDVVRDMEAADSPTIRENIWEWYLSVAYTRLAPGGGVLGILTWWNEDDWAGRIIQAMETGEGDQFEIVKYPAINDQGDEYILPDDTMIQIDDPKLVPNGARLTRKKGTAIHPERYTTQMMLNIKRNFIAGGQKRVWDALYQQNPTPDDGNFFTKEMFQYYGSPPDRRDLYVYQAWDFAISEGKESDYTVGTCIGVDHRDNVYVLDVRRFRSSDGGYIIDTILDFAAEYDADCLGFEDGQIWKAIEFQFQKRCEERKQYPSHELLKPLTDKMVRANPLRGRMQLGKVFFDKKAQWYDPMYREMIVFPAGKHDDHCLVAGTMIAMADGTELPIEMIREGDWVATPQGPCLVTAAEMTCAEAVVFEVAGLKGTARHPVFTQNRGWVDLETLTDSDILQVRVSQGNEESSWQGYMRKPQGVWRKLSLTGAFIGDTLNRARGRIDAIFRAQEEKGFCTGTYGSTTTVKYRKAGTFITRMATRSTTVLKTLSAYLDLRMTRRIPKNDVPMADQRSSSGILKRFAQKLWTGISLPKDWRGMLKTERVRGRSASTTHSPVSSVDQGLSQNSQTHSFAPHLVETSTGTKPIRNTTLPKMLAEKQPVYNITVADAHCYFANGVLVHNCDSLAWAIRLTLSRAAPRDSRPQPKLPSWKDKLKQYGGKGASHMCA